MNVYSELWELLRPTVQPPQGALLGTVTAISPLTVTVGETALTKQLYLPAGTALTNGDVGQQAALLPCGEDGFVVFFVEGGENA